MDSSIHRLRSQLGDLGFDLFQPFIAQDYNDLIASITTSSLPALPTFGRRRTAAVIVGNTAALWEPFLAHAARQQPLLADAVDCYVENGVHGALASSGFMQHPCPTKVAAQTAPEVAAAEPALAGLGLKDTAACGAPYAAGSNARPTSPPVDPPHNHSSTTAVTAADSAAGPIAVATPAASTSSSAAASAAAPPAAPKPPPLPCDVRFSHSTGPLFCDVMRAAEVAGLAFRDTTVHLCLHPTYGPWFALRAVIVFDADADAELSPARVANPVSPELQARLLSALAALLKPKASVAAAAAATGGAAVAAADADAPATATAATAAAAAVVAAAAAAECCGDALPVVSGAADSQDAAAGHVRGACGGVRGGQHAGESWYGWVRLRDLAAEAVAGSDAHRFGDTQMLYHYSTKDRMGVLQAAAAGLAGAV